jgi:hypothetical protein
VKTAISIDGNAVVGPSFHLESRASHTLTISATDRHGEPVTFNPGDVVCRMPNGALRNRPRSAATQVELTFPDRTRGAIECRVRGECRQIELFGFWHGLAIFVLMLALLLVPVFGVIALQTVVAVDPALALWQKFSNAVLQWLGVGTSLLVGFPAGKAAVKRWSIDPFLSLFVTGGGRLAMAFSALAGVSMLAARGLVFVNASPSEIQFASGETWKQGQLLLLVDRARVLRAPLCAWDDTDCKSPTESLGVLSFDWLAGNRVGCKVWPPSFSSGLKWVLSAGCKTATASAPGLELTFEYASSLEFANRWSIELGKHELIFKGERECLRLPNARIVSLSTGQDTAGNAVFTLGPGVEGVPGGVFRALRLATESPLGSSFPLPVEEGGILKASLSKSMDESPFGELTCRVPSKVDLLVLTATSALIGGAALYVDADQVSSYRKLKSGLDARMAFCVPRGGSQRRRLELLLEADWQPEATWRLMLPAAIEAVSFRLVDGRLLGTVTRHPNATDPREPTWILAAHHFEDGAGLPSRSPPSVIVDPKNSEKGWRRTLEESQLFARWFWLPSDVSGCRARLGSRIESFDCQADEVALPVHDCYFQNGVPVGACPGRARPPTSDERTFQIGSGAAGCQAVYVCQ